MQAETLRALITAALLPLAAGEAACQPEAIAPAGPVPRTSVGVNVGGLNYWDNERAIANLVGQTQWQFFRGSSRIEAPGLLEPNGEVVRLPDDVVAQKILIRPAGPLTSIDIHCTYDGTGTFKTWTALKMKSTGRNRFTATMSGSLGSIGVVEISSMSAADPVRNLDCREEAMPREAYFAPEFVSFIRNFAGIRFLGWQMPSAPSENWRPNWTMMANPKRTSQGGPEGVSVRTMVAVANEADVDPWFLMPYHADDEYVRNFARYVHDHLEPGRVAYIELGNEVWNWGFKTTHEAKEEGLAAGLHKDPFRALLRRYAQKSRHLFGIWGEVFADKPSRLVRVVATQSVCTEFCFKEILDFENTAESVDALAIAPYFGTETKGRTVADVDRMFTEMGASIDKVMGDAAAHKKLADRYGKRLIAYEGGQHIVTADIALAQALQRDPRMGRLYTRYLTEWQRRVGDRMMLLSATGPIGKHGSWGMREYAGQPDAEAPKLRATKVFIGTLGRN